MKRAIGIGQRVGDEKASAHGAATILVNGVVHYGMRGRLDARRAASMPSAMTATGNHTQHSSDASTCTPRSLKKRAPMGDIAMGRKGANQRASLKGHHKATPSP